MFDSLNSSPARTTKPIPAALVELPVWDDALKELRLGGRIVKQFQRAANNQQQVLAAFHRSGWTSWIADPLPISATVDSTRRLHDTIKFLNKGQFQHLIRFRGDGTGKGVFWEFVSAAE